MYYPQFTKAVIHHFMSKDPSIPRRNKVNWHYVRDDHMFSTIKLVSRHQNTQYVSALLPIKLTNEEIWNSNAYKEYYAIATGATPPKPKASVRRTQRKDDDDDEEDKGDHGDDDDDENDDGEDGNDDDDDHEVERDDDKDDEEEGGDDDQEYDDKYAKETRVEESFDHIPQTPKNNDDEGNGEEDLEGGDDDQEYDDKYAKETRVEESFDHIPQTPKNNDDKGNGEEDLGLNVGGEEHVEEDEEDELYKDININQGRGIQANLEVEDSHVSLTLVNLDGQQHSSSVSSQFATSMLNPTHDVGISQLDVQTPTSVAPLPMTAPTMTPSTISTITTTSQAPILPTTVPSNINQNLKNFGSLFRFDDRMRIKQAVNEQLEAKVLTRSSHSSKTSYVVAADVSEMELKKIIIEKMEGNKSIQRSDEQRNLQGPFSVRALKDLGSFPFMRLFDPWSGPAEGCDKHALWGVSHWGRKRQQFHGFAVNRESAHGKLTNLTVEERFAFNVSLQMFTRSIVIQRHVEDLQLGVESYQKKLNLTKPDSYRSDLKHKEAYTAYFNPWGFIYQNKDKRNRLMRIDELHKFSDGMLIDVRTALDDRLKGIRMQYLPQSIWRKSDKDRSAAMIHAIDKRLKTRRIMRVKPKVSLYISYPANFTIGVVVFSFDLQYPEIHPPSQETSDEVFQANHSIQNEKSLNEIAVLNLNEEKEDPSQDSDIRQLIRKECSVEASEEQKQSMEDTMFELVKICQEKEFLCIHDDVDDLIESAINSKLLLINSNSQRLNKKEQEVKNVVEQQAERGNRSIQSLQNFRVVHKSSISFNTSQISS
nr:hypothetical protein [Tanacetum cinerariifolium]